MRTEGILDTLIQEVDSALRTLVPPRGRVSQRVSPAQQVEDCELSYSQKKHIAGLMRVNHSGEVCAQALYQGQALTAQLRDVRKQMNEAALEEIDHLAWCEQRLTELGSKPSILNPLWYGSSLLLGMIAGFAGDKISLGFVAETERQVTRHLQQHIVALPLDDKKTKAILLRMQEDEEHHAQWAKDAGGLELPMIIKELMTLVSKCMTRTSYYI